MIEPSRWSQILAHAQRHEEEGFLDNDVSVLLRELQQSRNDNEVLCVAILGAIATAELHGTPIPRYSLQKAMEGVITTDRFVPRAEKDAMDLVAMKYAGQVERLRSLMKEVKSVIESQDLVDKLDAALLDTDITK